HAITSKSLVGRSQMQILFWSGILGDRVELLPQNQSGTGNQKDQQRKEFYSHRVASGLISETWDGSLCQARMLGRLFVFSARIKLERENFREKTCACFSVIVDYNT